VGLGPLHAPGLTIGRFSVLGLVGRGGLGEVYAAYDPELGRRVALKVLTGSDDRTGSARLRREATAMARLSHPNVARVYDVGSVGDRLFIAMEFIRGETLRSWLAARPRSWRDIRAVFLAAGQGLAAAHREGIVHRDFKPDNVLIDDEGRARVVDFGLASSVHTELHPAHPTADDDLSDTTQPSDANAGGTPAYMAPEQHLGRSAGDARSDQFSFCVTLFEALHGRRPFLGRTWQTLRPQVLRGDPGAARRKCPPHVGTAINRGLNPDPERRFPDMEALLAELSRDPPRSRARKLVIAGAAAAVLIGVAWRLTHRRDTTSPTCAADDPGCLEQRLRAQLDAADALATDDRHQALALARAVADTAERSLGPDHPLAREARDRRDTLAALMRY
jgi:eukaryotic-like serine/threonine-protein kinase